MSEPVTTVVRVLDNEYKIRCAEDELDDLQASAADLDERMRQIRGNASMAAITQIAIAAALNIAHDNLRLRRSLDAAKSRMEKAINRYCGESSPPTA